MRTLQASLVNGGWGICVVFYFYIPYMLEVSADPVWLFPEIIFPWRAANKEGIPLSMYYGPTTMTPKMYNSYSSHPHMPQIASENKCDLNSALVLMLCFVAIVMHYYQQNIVLIYGVGQWECVVEDSELKTVPVSYSAFGISGADPEWGKGM